MTLVSVTKTLHSTWTTSSLTRAMSSAQAVSALKDGHAQITTTVERRTCFPASAPFQLLKERKLPEKCTHNSPVSRAAPGRRGHQEADLRQQRQKEVLCWARMSINGQSFLRSLRSNKSDKKEKGRDKRRGNEQGRPLSVVMQQQQH
jgi:hypothetical protein